MKKLLLFSLLSGCAEINVEKYEGKPGENPTAVEWVTAMGGREHVIVASNPLWKPVDFDVVCRSREADQTVVIPPRSRFRMLVGPYCYVTAVRY